MKSACGLCICGLIVSFVLAGCGLKLEPVDSLDQQLLDKKTARVSHDGVDLTLRHDKAPKRFSKGRLVMRVELANRSAAPVRMSWRHAYLLDPTGLKVSAASPQELAEALLESYRLSAAGVAGNAFADAVVGVRGGYVRRPGYVYYGRYYGYPYGWHSPYYGPYGSYAYYGYYDYYDRYDDYWKERAEAVQFARRLWDDRLVNPGSVEWGYVVFEYVPPDEQVVQFVLEVARWVDERGNPLPLNVEGSPDVTIQPFSFWFRAD